MWEQRNKKRSFNWFTCNSEQQRQQIWWEKYAKLAEFSCQVSKERRWAFSCSSVPAGWSHFLPLTADTASFGEGIAERCPWASAAHSFPPGQIVVGAPCTPLPFPSAESEKQMHHSCWGKQHNRLMREGGSEEEDWGPYAEHQGKFLQRASGTTTPMWSRITPRKWEDEM